MEKKKQIIATGLVLLLFVMIIGISYAVFTFAGTGTKENVITVGKLSVSYAENTNIELSNKYSETDSVGIATTLPKSTLEFSVTSDTAGNENINYAVGIDVVQEGATLTEDYVKIYMLKEGAVATGFTSGTGKTIESFKNNSIEDQMEDHVVLTDTISGTDSHDYTVKAWVSDEYDLPTTDTSSGNTHSNTTTSETFKFKIKVAATTDEMVVKITSKPNAPELATGMIPVYYDGSVWRKADSTNQNETYKWYDYDSKMWANAVTVTQSNGTRTDLTGAPLGTEIPMSRINTMLVWIPRFSATGDTANYNGGTQSSPGAFNITFVDSNTNAHDAFDFGGAISGFWISKFEVSTGTTNCVPGTNSAVGRDCNLTTINPYVVPNVAPWAGAMVSIFYRAMLEMKTETSIYGFDTSKDTTLDTHMLKNNEWGAVAYLTQSIYGRCTTSTSCTEVGINNKGTTGYGAPAGTNSSVPNGAYNTTKGMAASTTGNIYGVYDMNGGVYEYVMGVYWDGSKYWSGNSTSSNKHSGFNGCLGSSCSSTLETGIAYPSDRKYFNLYTTEDSYTSSGLQHAMVETKNWYGDSANFVSGNYPWFLRSGVHGTDSSYAGVFHYSASSGNAYTYGSSRLSLVK